MLAIEIINGSVYVMRDGEMHIRCTDVDEAHCIIKQIKVADNGQMAHESSNDAIMRSIQANRK